MNQCQFCGQPSTLLCDGRIYEIASGSFRVPPNFVNGKTRSCDAHICRACAKKIGDVHLNMGRKGCRWDTRDLCPECQKVQDKPIRISSNLPSANDATPQPQSANAEKAQATNDRSRRASTTK